MNPGTTNIVSTPVNSTVSAPGRSVPRYGSWQEALKDAVRDPSELCRLVGLPQLAADAHAAADTFSVFAPRSYIARMRVADPGDPLLRQVLPLQQELASPQGYSADPVGDLASALRPGLLHKYQSRVLMVTTGACAVHCRYCFRRHFPYSQAPRSPQDWAPALDTIASDASIREVILSGGDPLTLVDGQLAVLAQRLGEIGHLRRLRIHTRLPIMIPQRVTGELIAWLRGMRLTPIVVLHANHAQELGAEVAEAIATLADAGIVLLNQAVLLRGINDTVDAQAELCERLVDMRVMPYYLHQLDRVIGAAHFEVPESTGQELMQALRERLPGYAVPRYVRETAGAPYKVPLA